MYQYDIGKFELCAWSPCKEIATTVARGDESNDAPLCLTHYRELHYIEDYTQRDIVAARLAHEYRKKT